MYYWKKKKIICFLKIIIYNCKYKYIIINIIQIISILEYWYLRKRVFIYVGFD